MISVWKNIIASVEFWLLKTLLRRHAMFYMDQWDLWELKTKSGDIFITISREPIDGNTGGYIKI